MNMNDDLLTLLEQQLTHLQSLQIVMKNEELLLGYHRVPHHRFKKPPSKSVIWLPLLDMVKHIVYALSKKWELWRPTMKTLRFIACGVKSKR